MQVETKHESRTRSRRPRTKHQLRCFCPRRPIIAMYGLDVTGRLYLHIMIYKQHRVFGNIVVRGGPVELQCRECARWHVINFSPEQRLLQKETSAPDEVELPPLFVRQANDDTHVAE